MAKNVYASKLRFDDSERWLRSDGKAAKAEKKVNRARRRAHYAAVFREESAVNISGMPVTFTTESMEKTRFGKILQQHGRNMQKVYSFNRQMLNSIEESADGDLSMDALRTVNETLDMLATRAHNKSVKRDNRLVKRSKKLDKANRKNVASHIKSSGNVKGEYVYRQENGRSSVTKKNGESSMGARYSDQSAMFQSSYDSHSMSQPNTSKSQQKKQIKREYAKQKRDSIRGRSSSQSFGYGNSGRSNTASRSQASSSSAAPKKKGKAKTVLIASSAAVILLLFLPMMSFGGVGGAVSGAAYSAGQYPATEESIRAAEEYYCGKENELNTALASVEESEETAGHDEYIYELDSIEHDPYVLISMVSAFQKGEEWLFNDEIKSLLDEIFARQYTQTIEVNTETRSRTELQTDPNTGEEIEVEVEYEYSICTVALENFNLSHLPVHMMNEEMLSYYALYMSTLGCMEALFPDSRYVDLYITNPPEPYSVDWSYFSDPTFASIITEAEKYLGYPYVWGGYNPNTSFDCSGYVSWVINQCGWNVGRLGAQGLYGICSPIRRDQALPGDLIFFTGTYDAEYPVTHVGIYVGHGMMIHCGDPIQYASFETPYFQQHYYSMGRLPAQGG